MSTAENVSVVIGGAEFFVERDLFYRIISQSINQFQKLKKVESNSFPLRDKEALEQARVLYSQLIQV